MFKQQGRRAKHRFYLYEGLVPNMIPCLNWTHIFEWYVHLLWEHIPRRHMFKKNWIMCSKDDKHLKLNSWHNQGNIYNYLNEHENLHFNNEQDIYMSSKIHKESGCNLDLEMLTILHWPCVSYPSRNELGKVTIQDLSTLHQKTWWRWWWKQWPSPSISHHHCQRKRGFQGRRPHTRESSKQKHVTKEKRKQLWTSGRGTIITKGAYGGGKLGGGGGVTSMTYVGRGVYGVGS